MRRAKEARVWLFVAIVVGLLVVPWLSETVADRVFEPERQRRLFRPDRVTRHETAETLEKVLQLVYWLASLGFVARKAWRERPTAGPGSAPGEPKIAISPTVYAAPPANDVAACAASQAEPTTRAVDLATAPGRAGALLGGEALTNGSVRYRIESELGRGGMGIVYRARDTVLDRPVALKSLPPELLAYPELVRRFEREARVLASLSHPHVVNVFDLVLQDGQLFMAMELVEGTDLSTLMEERGRLCEAEAVSFGLQVARALAHAHSQGIIHRDFKPDNVLITRDGAAKVTDFGIAKAQDGPRMTQTGAVMGTPHYMSPEQASGDEIDPRTDLYALGITLYELLSGEPPFVGSTAQVLMAHMTREPDPLAKRVSGLSPELCALVDALLRKKREDRPSSMEVVIQRLEALTVAPVRA